MEFLLKDILKSQVITHAPVFKGVTFDDYFNQVRESEAFKGVDNSTDIEKLVDTFKQSNWQKKLIPEEYGGELRPSSITLALEETFLRKNLLFKYIFGSYGTAELIDLFGSKEQKKEFCQKLYNLEFFGETCIRIEKEQKHITKTGLSAEKNDNYYKITGSLKRVQLLVDNDSFKSLILCTF